MDPATTTSGRCTLTILPPTPEFYVEHGCCPQCGAAIYRDGKIETTEHGHLKTLPFPYYTCTCRYNVQPSLIPAPIVWPAEVPPVNPWPGPTWALYSNSNRPPDNY